MFLNDITPHVADKTDEHKKHTQQSHPQQPYGGLASKLIPHGVSKIYSVSNNSNSSYNPFYFISMTLPESSQSILHFLHVFHAACRCLIIVVFVFDTSFLGAAILFDVTTVYEVCCGLVIRAEGFIDWCLAFCQFFFLEQSHKIINFVLKFLLLDY